MVFAGNLGTARALDTLVRAAEALGMNPVRLLLVGSGSHFAWLQRQQRDLQLNNLEAGAFPMEAMPQIFREEIPLSLNDRQSLPKNHP